MARYFLGFLLLKVLLVVHAQSHPLNAPREPAPAELIDIIDDDILYGSTPPGGYSFETFPYGPEPTSFAYGGLFDDPSLSHTTSQSQTSSLATNTSSVVPTHTTKAQTLHTPTPTSEPVSSSTVQPTATAFSPPGASAETNALPRSDSRQWKIIGLVIICITFIAVATLTIVFFDAWWGFLRGLVCRRKYGQEREDMVPDWEKRSWEYKITIPSEDRYPTTGSMENLTANAAGIGAGEGRSRMGQELLPNPHPLATSRLASPQPMYVPEYDRHPLEPLVRRPSTNPRSPYA